MPNGKHDRHPQPDPPTTPGGVGLSLPWLIFLIMAALQVTGFLVQSTLFWAAGFNYADFAVPSDLLTAGTKSPIALLAGVATVVVLLLLHVAVQTDRRTMRRWGLLGVGAVILSGMLSLWWAASTTPLWGIDRAAPPPPLASLLSGAMPFVRIDSSDPAVNARLQAAANVQVLAGVGEIYLLNVDGNPQILRRDSVVRMTGAKWRAPATPDPRPPTPPEERTP